MLMKVAELNYHDIPNSTTYGLRRSVRTPTHDCDCLTGVASRRTAAEPNVGKHLLIIAEDLTPMAGE